MLTAYSADAVFTGEGFVNGAAVVVENNVIKEVVPVNNISKKIPVTLHTKLIAPAFIDIQIYGASSKLFSVFPEADTLYKMHEHCVSGGTKFFLPTIATNTNDVLLKGIDAIKNYWSQGGQGVLGLHVEGPWINKQKKGAHVENLIHSPDLEEAKALLDYGKGVIKIITLAPEVCTKEVIELIKSYHIIVSAGHSNAGYHEAEIFFKNITLATHLFNAMSSLHHREPGLPVSVMLNENVMASIVADGYHVDFAMIALAKKLMKDRLFFITDAVTETDKGPYPHVKNGEKYESNGILSGSSLTMMKAVKNVVERCEISLDEALRMASLYPAKVLDMDDAHGKIKEGYQADFVFINEHLDIVQCI